MAYPAPYPKKRGFFIPLVGIIFSVKKGKVMDEIIKQIEKLKAEREQVKGTPCEVYSRVCGYLRPTQSWNKGKQEEFKQRKMIKI